MGQGCCGQPGVAPEHFHCHSCGHCCTQLTDRWDQGAAAKPFQAMAGPGLYRLATRGGLRMFSWEAQPFQDEALDPLLVLLDAQRQRPVALAYELQAEACPQWQAGIGCTIYDERPLVCQAYPLLVVPSPEGPSVAVSSPCPAKVPVLGALQVTSRPEEVLFGLYPQEAGPALAVPALVEHLAELTRFLTTAGVIEPVAGLDEEEVEPWMEREVIDLVALVEEVGVMTRRELQERQAATIQRLRDRWMG